MGYILKFTACFSVKLENETKLTLFKKRVNIVLLEIKNVLKKGSTFGFKKCRMCTCVMR